MYLTISCEFYTKLHNKCGKSLLESHTKRTKPLTQQFMLVILTYALYSILNPKKNESNDKENENAIGGWKTINRNANNAYECFDLFI